MTGVAIPDFKQLQTWANDGQIIVGVLKEDSESGHVVMLVPHSNDLENDKIYDYRKILKSVDVAYLMPKTLECGKEKRGEVYTLQAGVTSAKIQNMKWYKMVGIYTSPKNNIK
jgi:predicted methyltransferase